MDAIDWKKVAGGLALPAVLAAAVGVAAYFPPPERIEAARDRVAAWWGGPGSPGPIGPDPIRAADYAPPCRAMASRISAIAGMRSR